MLYPDEVRGVVGDGHEIAIHSWIHERNNLLSYNVERELSFRAAEKLSEISGRDPVGMRTASWDFSPNTLEIIREMGLLYDSSLMADDDPYELLANGEPSGVSSCLPMDSR